MNSPGTPHGAASGALFHDLVNPCLASSLTLGTTVRILVHDLQISVVHAETGQIIRDLTLDPTRD